jgi:hypothetical protein
MSGVSYKQFFTDPSMRWRFFLACVINFGQQATGQGRLLLLRCHPVADVCIRRFVEQLLDYHLPKGVLEQQHHPADQRE